MSIINQWVNKFDDRVNPIVLKELRQAVNGKFVAAVLGIFLLISLIAVTVALLYTNPNDASEAMGLVTLLWLNGILVATCVLFLPVYTAVRMAAERSDTNTDLLFISTLRPRQIISGKLLASAILGMLIYSACMPFMTLTYLLRGVDLPSIFLVMVMGYTIVVVAIALALFAACATVSRGFRVMLALSMLGSLGFIIFMAVGASIAITESGFASMMDEGVFWGIIASWLMSVICAVAMLFSFSVAMISPPTANRAVGVRLTVLCAWVVNTGAAWIWAWQTGEGDALGVIAFCGIVFASGMMLMAAGERDQWTNRLLSTVPKTLLSRMVAMLFYSGALGGFLFAWMILVGTLGVLRAGNMTVPGMELSDYDKMLRVTLGIVVFVYAYGLTARLLQRFVLGRWVKQEQTWALAVVIGSLCIALGWVMQLLVDGPYYSGNTNYWQVLSPVGMFFSGELQEGATLLVGATWAIIITAVHVPWFMKQLQDFHRPAEQVG